MHSIIRVLIRTRPGELPKWPFIGGHLILVLAALTVLAIHQPLDGATIVICCFAAMAGVGVLVIPYYFDSRRPVRKVHPASSPVPTMGRSAQPETNSRPETTVHPAPVTASPGVANGRRDGEGKTLIQAPLPIPGVVAKAGAPVPLNPVPSPATGHRPAETTLAPNKSHPSGGSLLGRAFATAQTTAQTRAVNRLIETGFSKANPATKEKDAKDAPLEDGQITTGGR